MTGLSSLRPEHPTGIETHAAEAPAPGLALTRLLASFAALADKPAVVAFGSEAAPRILTFGELEDRAMRLARIFTVGEPVALFAPNSIEWIVARFALIAAGAVAVHCDPEWHGERVAHVLRLAKCRRVMTTTALASRLPNDVEILDLDRLTFGERRDAAATPSPDDEAALFFTSGTTGPPKAVPLSHRNILCNVDAVLGEAFLRRDDRLLLPLPLYHAYPFIIGLVTPLSRRASGRTAPWRHRSRARARAQGRRCQRDDRRAAALPRAVRRHRGARGHKSIFQGAALILDLRPPAHRSTSGADAFPRAS